MEHTDTFPSQCYANRELSWLQFNERVLEEAADCANPLMERLNFVSIFQSNLDEFYMVRVGMLMDTLDMGITDDKLGMTSAQQLSAVLERTRELLSQRDRLFKSLMQELTMSGEEKLFSCSEFDKMEVVRFIEHKNELTQLLDDTFSGIQVKFGAENDSFVIKSASNIPGVKTALVNTINVYDILNYDKFIVAKDAVAKIEEVYA